jgi:hypothetical protein
MAPAKHYTHPGHEYNPETEEKPFNRSHAAIVSFVQFGWGRDTLRLSEE